MCGLGLGRKKTFSLKLISCGNKQIRRERFKAISMVWMLQKELGMQVVEYGCVILSLPELLKSLRGSHAEALAAGSKNKIGCRHYFLQI